MVFETTGGVNDEGLELLRQMFRFAAKHQSRQLSVYAVVRGRVSHAVCNLLFLNVFLIVRVVWLR